MQLKNIKISNLFSFPYNPNLNTDPGIPFAIKKNGAVNVLIGPNGSGKTNFLEIIHQIIKCIKKDFTYKEELGKTSIQEVESTLFGLKKHFSHPEKESKVIIAFHITKNDQENLIYIQKHRNEINKIIQENSDLNIQFTQLEPVAIKGIENIELDININRGQQKIEIQNSKYDIEQEIIKYLEYIELLQICISLCKKNDNESSLTLKNTCAFLGAERHFPKDFPTTLPQSIRQNNIKQKKDEESVVYSGYYLCLAKLYHSKDNLKESIFFKSLSETIKKYLNAELHIIENEVNNKIELGICLIDSLGQKQDLQDLSHGEQSLFLIICTIYGYDLRNGLLIIDEPETHFHPLMQKRLIKMLEDISENIGTQFIVSTYSPMFINEENIGNVYRFSKQQGETKVITPSSEFLADESALIQILKFENAAKIFFVDKIIMVEGETDAYFFEHYLQYLHNQPQRKNTIKNYEIININGKGEYQKRNTFLKKFGIESYFIGDRDNIVNYNIAEQEDLNHYYKEAKGYYSRLKKQKNSNDRHYTRLVRTIRDLHPETYKYILEEIKKLYERDIFILESGDIETYLGLREKGLQETIMFCHHEFMSWIKDSSFEEMRNEMENIFSKIFA